jgi:hypothetical protein
MSGNLVKYFVNLFRLGVTLVALSHSLFLHIGQDTVLTIPLQWSILKKLSWILLQMIPNYWYSYDIANVFAKYIKKHSYVVSFELKKCTLVGTEVYLLDAGKSNYYSITNYVVQMLCAFVDIWKVCVINQEILQSNT